MKVHKISRIMPIVIVVIIGVFFIITMNDLFEHSALVKSLFSGDNANAVMGEVSENSEASLAHRAELAAKLSMYIFAVITVLQLVAFAVGCVAVNGIRHTEGTVKSRIALLDNSEIFFDVPLYVGLFGTVSAFLVMTFSPQSSRLIAYSSTLIGIIFSLVLRLTMQYPLRKKLISEQENSK